MSASLLRLLLITCACTREVPLYLSVCVKVTDCPFCCTGRGLFVPLGAPLSPPQDPLYGGLAARAGPRTPAVALRLVEAEEEAEEAEARVAFRRDAADAAESRLGGPGGARLAARDVRLSGGDGGGGDGGGGDGGDGGGGGGGREVSKRYGGFMRRVGRPKGRWPKRAKKKRYGGFIHRFFGLAIRSPRLA
ncbi:unnamed protein product [Lampetra fluviatilis]